MSTMAAMSPLRVPSCPSTELGQLCSDGQVSSGRKLSVHGRHQYRQLPSPSLSQIGRGLSLHSSQRNLQNSAIIKIIFKRSRCSNTTNGPQFFGIIVGHKEGHVQNQNLSQKYDGRIGKSRAGHLQDQLVNWSWSTGPGQLVLVNWSWSTGPGQLSSGAIRSPHQAHSSRSPTSSLRRARLAHGSGTTQFSSRRTGAPALNLRFFCPGSSAGGSSGFTCVGGIVSSDRSANT